VGSGNFGGERYVVGNHPSSIPCCSLFHAKRAFSVREARRCRHRVRLSDWADRQAALDAEIELAKAKAAIELETQRKAQALRAEQPLQGADGTEEVKLGRRHPQWSVIVTSSVFNTWLRTRPGWYQKMCAETPKADIMGSCIDDFFGAKIVQVE
jgi:hypothetical protein